MLHEERNGTWLTLKVKRCGRLSDQISVGIWQQTRHVSGLMDLVLDSCFSRHPKENKKSVKHPK